MKQNKDFAKNKDVVVEEEEEIEEYSLYEDDPEIFFDYQSEEIATAYHILTDWIASQGLPLLENCTFPDFVEFCWKFSSGRKPVC
ncbi:hypothetical protein PBCVNEJV1_208R [Paramecium bursaria Chlorella virus NE-JV-1]|nr:hypothetical protein PBCVNEJV1_208R [Paramecium bursaria Chlorella virus NE-JV-1]